MKSSISVVGQGFVGGSVTAGFSKTYDINACDISGKFSDSATNCLYNFIYEESIILL